MGMFLGTSKSFLLSLLVSSFLFSSIISAQQLNRPDDKNFHQESIEKILNGDGTIKAGTSGSFDANGYKMEYGDHGQPVFKNTSSLEKTSSTATWSSLGTGRDGINGAIYAMAVSISGDIYVGGSFQTAGEIIANNIAKWNGSSWSALSGGGINGVGSGSNIVYAIAISGSDVYAGGNFTTLGDGTTSANRVAKWNGSSWSALTGGGINGVSNLIRTIAVSGSNVYVGGDFTTLGDNSTAANYIAKWNGSSWSALTGGGINGLYSAVYAIAIGGSNVYVGGAFSYLNDGATLVNCVARWNGSSWSALSAGGINGVSSFVNAITVSGSDVYVGGMFTQLGDYTTAAKYIAKWNGSSWSALSAGGINGVGTTVGAISVNGSDVYVGGGFSTLGDGITAANYIAKWNGSGWSALSAGGINGVGTSVNAIAVSGGNIYIGGSFTTLGDGTTTAYRIAKWDGGTVSAISTGGLNGTSAMVRAIAVSGSDVYVGGAFTALGSGTTTANRIAKWNGSSWSALTGSGINGVGSGTNTVYAIAVSGSDIYVGGNFTTLGDGTTSANRVAKWNGSSWSALTGSGINGVGSGSNIVYAIAVSGSDVYVGGNFTTLGDGTTTANRIAKWNGSSWSALTGSGINGVGSGTNIVYAVAVSGSDVYVGGNFTKLGDAITTANRIAKWDGSSWSALSGGGINGIGSGTNIVYAIAVSGSDIYVGGSFTTLGDATTPANRIAKWNGSSWSALTGSGINGVGGTIYALAVSLNDVYVGGSFTTVGDGITSAKYFVKWNGSSWETLLDGSTNGVNNSLYAITVNSNERSCYIGGTFNIVGTSTPAFYIAKFTDSGNPLPVELKSFTASPRGKDVLLNWQTETEVNNFGFEVERIGPDVFLRSSDWKKIGFVQGHGNSNSPQYYSFVDNTINGYGTYSYRLKQMDYDGKYEYSNAADVKYTGGSFDLSQNYPNPFNPVTSFSYQVVVNSRVTIKVFNSLGEEVRTLVDEFKPAGRYTVEFNALNLSSGVYYYLLRTGEYSALRKMVYLK